MVVNCALESEFDLRRGESSSRRRSVCDKMSRLTSGENFSADEEGVPSLNKLDMKVEREVEPFSGGIITLTCSRAFIVCYSCLLRTYHSLLPSDL